VKKILVVEDYEDTLAMMRIFLKMNGYQVLEATNGKDAIETASRELPDLILMDISLPLVNGIETTRILKAIAETKHIPVLVITVRSNNPSMCNQAIEAGAIECFGKPVDLELLTNAVKKYTEGEVSG